jgi:uncharacterized protein YecE (DUF72 family)
VEEEEEEEEVEEKEEEEVVVVVVVVVAAAEARLWRYPQVTQAMMRFRCYHRDSIKIYFSTRYDY